MAPKYSELTQNFSTVVKINKLSNFQQEIQVNRERTKRSRLKNKEIPPLLALKKIPNKKNNTIRTFLFTTCNLFLDHTIPQNNREQPF
jgi:hypothetical protein